MSSLRGRVFGLSRPGPGRARNEDRFMLQGVGGGLLAAVADGVGGNRNGALAATLAMRSMRAFDTARAPGEALLSRVLAADLDIRAARRTDDDLSTMCTTLTAVYVRDGAVDYVHTGDSRLYLVRGGAARAVTRDHTVLQRYLDAGDITEAQAVGHPARNALHQCLGCPMLEPDSGSLDARPGDVLFLCTDGLYNAAGPEAMGRALGNGTELRAGVLALADVVAPAVRDDFTFLAVRV